MDVARKIKTKVLAGFKMRGLILRPEASRYLVEVLESVSPSELDDVIERVLDAVEKQPLSSSMIELSVVETAVQDCTQSCDETIDNVFNIIGAFDVPRYIYSVERKKFVPISMTRHPAPSLCGLAKDKAELFRERYTILQQRTHRHELFTPPAIGAAVEEGQNKFQLKTIEALLGSTAKLGEVIVLGMITQLKEGKFYLEDPSGTVQLDMSKAQFHNGLYTESCFVLAEGWYEDSVFHVNGFGFPPTEPSSGTRAYYGNMNFFGGPSTTSVKASAKLKQLEEENEDAMFVIVSDVWLDNVEVMEKLNIMFSGYAAMPPTCFILCGNFSSAPYGKTQIKSLKESLKALADAICAYPNIHSSSRFVFVPGPEDPGPGTILPRPPLADHITEEFRQKVPFSVFTTNPCRIQYCSQEIVIIREDLVNKMCRNCVRLPNNNLDIPNHENKTSDKETQETGMAERMAEMEEDIGDLPAREDDNDSDRDEDDRLFAWMVNDDMDEDEEEDEVEELEDEQLLDTEASESFELDTPAERSGHIAVVDRNVMYVWGGYKNAQNHGFFDLYLPRTEIWTYNMESGVWTKHIAGGNLHMSMSGSCGVCVDGVLYLFGGHHARGNTNRIYRLPLRAPSLVWEEMSDLKGLPPSSKDKLGCWVQKNRLIFFGGYGYAAQGPHQGTFEYDESSSLVWDSPGRGWNNHIHILDLETYTWSQPVTTGNTPSPRAAHACATVGNRGYVFGGRYKNYRLNDLYYIDLDTWEWHEMSVPQQCPVGRSWHSFTPVSSDLIFLFGGFTTDRETLSDAWLYCVSKNEWKPFKHSHTQSPRLWHTACSGPDGEVFVFGGCANNLLSHHRAAHSNELLVFNVQPKSLVRFCMEAILQHRERLSSYWDCLPKPVLHSLKQRMSRVNTLGS